MFVVETLAESGEMFVCVPLGVVVATEFLFGLNVQGAPAIVQMFEDLEGSDITIRSARVYSLARSFTEHKASPENITTYNKLYGQFLRIVKDTASKIGRRKFGYMRSPPLVLCGEQYLAARFLHDCRLRGAPPTTELRRLCLKLGLEVDTLILLPEATLRHCLRQSRHALWECQKKGETPRSEWLATVAQDRARAAGDPDWEARLKLMNRRAKDNSVNCKLSALTKGRRGALT